MSYKTFSQAMKRVGRSNNLAVIKARNGWKVVSLKAALARGL